MKSDLLARLARYANETRLGPHLTKAGEELTKAGEVSGGHLNAAAHAWDNIPQGYRKAAIGTGIAAYGVSKFRSGVSSTTGGDTKSSFYETVLGIPDADQVALGTNISPMSLLDPLVSSRPALPMAVGGGLLGAGIGGAIGGFASGKKGVAKFALGAVGGLFTGAGLGAAASVGPAERRNIRLAANGTMLNRHFTARKNDYYDNTMPTIDGSVVMALYGNRGR